MTIATLLDNYVGISTDNISIYLKDKTLLLCDGVARIYDLNGERIDSISAFDVVDKLERKQLDNFTVDSNQLIIFEKGAE